MNRHQKIAWFTLVMLSLSLGLSLTGFCIGLFIFGVSAQKASCAFGLLGLFGFVGLSPILFRKDKEKTQFDERDLLIRRKAMLVAYSVFWVLFVAAAMVPWGIIGPNGTITVNYLPWMVFGGGFVVWGIQSIMILNEYGWRNKNE